MIDQELVQQLHRSKEVVGEISAIVIDYDGEVLSGLHRQQAGWTKTVHVDSRKLAEKWGVTPLMAKDMVRIHTNIQRKVSKEETQFLVRRMALSLKEQGIPEEEIASELAKHVPYSDRYVRELLPAKYKKVKYAPKREPELVPVPPIRVEKAVRRPTEEELKQRIHAPISTFDVRVFAGMSGWLTQHEICIYSLIPDGFHPEKRVCVFLDGPGHKGGPREEELREALKRRGYTVVELKYEDTSKKTLEELRRQVAELA